MDPPTTMVKTFKYNSSQQPMFSVLEPPLHYRSSLNSTTFEDISFSSYLKSNDPCQKENDCPVNDDTEISIFDAQKYFSENSDPKDMMMIKTQQEQQQQDPSSQDLRLSSVSSVDGFGRNYRTRSFRATPTASSEASWNSQTGLLANPPGSIGVSLRNFPSGEGKKRSSMAKKWIFGRKCCCNGKESVQVKEVTSDSEHGGPGIRDENNNNGKANYLCSKRDSHKAKTVQPSMSQRSSITNDVVEVHQHKVLAPTPVRLSLENANSFPPAGTPRPQRVSSLGRPFADGTGGFSFPILSPSSQATKKTALKGIVTKAVNVNPIQDPPRESLEVFQPILEPPPVTCNENTVGVRPQFSPGSPIARVTNTDDDLGSDASSDLFEIESFSTQTTSYPMYRRRDSLDEAPTFNARRFASANGINLNSNNSIQYGRSSLDEPPTPSVAATECYAPSEVSIDWSVTTAEGFDRASVSNFSVSASEVGNTTAFLRQRQEEARGGDGGDGGKRKGNGGLLLMSCRQEKAVSVGPQPVKCAAPAAEGPPVLPLHVGGRPPRANKPPMGSSHSARLSLAFAA
ncbi:protein PHYTOCHROME KINASE SUBSTRATE 4 [Sesamum angolense]|uniref:Protein PHYTOCHROME KINASE SUBSTRATE 4 n=1 Tax=Sesamum angolense TaxID=2727404 RepID=A0AAE2C0Y3_9LAMI|nr:protein PHYTOCHROME KINASE SUBSTRATE 4 [Sesamum angolense]